MPPHPEHATAIAAALGLLSLFSGHAAVTGKVCYHGAFIRPRSRRHVSVHHGIIRGVSRNLRLSSLEFGIMFAVIAAALIIFSKVNGVFLNRYNTTQMVTAGLPLFAVSTVVPALVSGTHTF